MRYPRASTEPLEIIRANECEADVSLATSRFQALWNEIERLQTENWQLKQACGYPIPADKETIHNPFKCGICDARAQNYSGEVDDFEDWRSSQDGRE